MPQRLVILGTGGNAYDVLDVVDAINGETPQWQLDGFLDDKAPADSHYLGLPVLGSLGDARKQGDCRFVSAIWNDRVFRSLHEILARTGLAADRFATLVHPGAAVSRRAQLGRGVVVQHGATIAGKVEIGDHVWIGPGCTIGHGTSVADYSILAPGALLGGNVQIGRNCYVGSGALVLPQVHLGERSLSGMGAVVIADVPPGETVVGCPARPIIRRSRDAAGPP